MKSITCVICPKGCVISRSGEELFSGYKCARGLEYARNEFTNPVRMLSSTVRISGGSLPRLPVKTNKPIPKNKIFEAMNLLNGVETSSPIQTGDIVVENILGLEGVHFVAARDL